MSGYPDVARTRRNDDHFRSATGRSLADDDRSGTTNADRNTDVDRRVGTQTGTEHYSEKGKGSEVHVIKDLADVTAT
jgi:hypothetical protein